MRAVSLEEQTHFDWTPLHTAVLAGVCPLPKGDPSAAVPKFSHSTPFQLAFENGQWEMLPLLLARPWREKPWLARRMYDKWVNGPSVLDACVEGFPQTRPVLWLLLSNGASLSQVWPVARFSVTREMREFEDSIKQCRVLCRALMGMRRNRQVWQKIALAVWAAKK